MAIVTGKAYKTGDTVRTNEIGEFPDNLENLEIDDKNTAENWATQQHFKVGSKINEVKSDRTVTSFSTSSTTWVDVTNVEIPATVMEDETGRDNILRVQYDCLTGEHTCAEDIGADNLYAVRVQINCSNGSFSRAYSINKFTIRTWNPANAFLNPDSINWRSIAGSGLFIVPAGVTVNTIKLQAIVKNSANTMVLDRCNLTAIIGRA